MKIQLQVALEQIIHFPWNFIDFTLQNFIFKNLIYFKFLDQKNSRNSIAPFEHSQPISFGQKGKEIGEFFKIKRPN
jgi:hypothetical protein